MQWTLPSSHWSSHSQPDSPICPSHSSQIQLPPLHIGCQLCGSFLWSRPLWSARGRRNFWIPLSISQYLRPSFIEQSALRPYLVFYGSSRPCFQLQHFSPRLIMPLSGPQVGWSSFLIYLFIHELWYLLHGW